MKKYILSLFVSFLLVFSGLIVIGDTSAAPPPNFQTTQIIGTGLNGPTGFDIAPDGRIFILERTGKIWIYKNGQLLAQPFADLPSAESGDRGLTGIAFDPNFAANHYVYFYGTGTDLINRLVRFDASADIGTGMTVIFQTSSPSFELHIGGTIRFAVDGTLFISIGDNGVAENAQDLSNPHGKILRINKNGTVPSDNPFVGQSGALPEIWAYGFRNPYRFQLNPVNGAMYVGDVGDNLWEEVNLVEKGKNYGWPICEGVCSAAGMTNPIYAYSHDGISSAVVAGPVYRGSIFPAEYQGNLLFGDYARGFIKRMVLSDTGGNGGVFDFDTSAGSVVDIKEAPDGSLYYITYIPGRLYRITYSTTSSIPVANSAADKIKGTEPLTVNFSSEGSYDPDGDPITYLWDFGDGSISTEANPTKIYSGKGTYTVELLVSDNNGNSAHSVPITIQVGIPPTVHIGSPTDNSTYKSGDTIFYSASALDAAGYDIPDGSYITEVVFHHGTHIHPFLGPVDGRSGTFEIPKSGEADIDQWYEILVTATDGSGLSTTESVAIYPQLTTITFRTVPSGLKITSDGAIYTSPITFESIVNYERLVSAPTTQDLAGTEYQFRNWSDGGKIKHVVTAAESPLTLSAGFEATPSYTGSYYLGTTLTGAPVFTRNDAKINFNWGFGSPDPRISDDGFSVRWTKRQYFSEGRYVFDVATDDGTRLYIDDNLVIDKWFDQSPTAYRALVWLTTGEHDIKMEYYESVGGSVAEMFWELALDQTPPDEPIPTLTPTVTPTPTPTPVEPAVNGLTGEYYDNIDLTALVITRTDQAVNFDWGSGSPDLAISPDTFSVRWTGYVEPLFSEAYTFYTVVDDGVRLWVDGQLVIDRWIDHSPVEWISLPIQLTSGQRYEIKMEFYENGGGAMTKLLWESTSQAKEIIPNLRLFRGSGNPTPTPTPSSSLTPTPTPTATLTPTVTSTPTPTPDTIENGLKGEYYNNMDLTVLALSQTDPVVNFDWLFNSPDPGIATDTFSVRWSGQVLPLYSQAYTFYTVVDDGVRLWVNNQLVIDQWVDHSPVEYVSIPITLTGGQKYDIRMEFYENMGGAMAKLLWSSISQPKQIIPEASLFTEASDPTPTPTLTPTPTPTGILTLTPTPSPTPTPVIEGYSAELWNLGTTTYPPAVPVRDPDITRTDANVYFNWKDGAPDPAITADNFLIRWTGSKIFESGNYKFSVLADDGVRVYIDGELIIDQWKDQSPSSYSVDKLMTDGDHTIRIEYYEHGYDAVCEFGYFKL